MFIEASARWGSAQLLFNYSNLTAMMSLPGSSSGAVLLLLTQGVIEYPQFT